MSPAGSTPRADELLSAAVAIGDLILDARSNLYVSTLSGGQFRYVADTIGYVFRVTPTGVSTPETSPFLYCISHTSGRRFSR